MPLRLAARASDGVQGCHIVRTADLVRDGPVSGGRIFHKPIYPGEETLERGKTRGTDAKKPPPICPDLICSFALIFPGICYHNGVGCFESRLCGRGVFEHNFCVNKPFDGMEKLYSGPRSPTIVIKER